MVQRLQNLITVSCFARPPLLPAGSPRQKGNANKNEINWTAKKKRKIYASINSVREGQVGLCFFFLGRMWVLSQTAGSLSICCLSSFLSAQPGQPHPLRCPLERSQPHDLVDSSGLHYLQTVCDRPVSKKLGKVLWVA